ncbi:zinc ribbon domain-containing protein [Clostridioides difficile]|nr:zinc ribbon domain-containing protein [Clostridioides difficile]
MRITYKGRKTDKDLKYYYICGTKKTLGADNCNCKNLNGPLVESLIIDKIKNCKEESIISTFNNNNIKTGNIFNVLKSETNLLKNQILDKEKLIKNLVIELAKNTDSIASDYIVSQIENLNSEINILKDKLNTLESSNANISSDSINLDIIVSNLKRFNDEVDNASLDDKRLLLSTIINSIVWDSNLGNLNIIYMGAEMDNSVSLSN